MRLEEGTTDIIWTKNLDETHTSVGLTPITSERTNKINVIILLWYVCHLCAAS